MTSKALQQYSDDEVEQLGARLADHCDAHIERALDQRMEIMRGFVRELVRVEIEPLRARERTLSAKLAAIQQAALPARGQR
jgi:hypothetical protein